MIQKDPPPNDDVDADLFEHPGEMIEVDDIDEADAEDEFE